MEVKRNIEILLQYLSPRRKEKFFKVLEHRTKYVTVVLEDIYDPHNGSACLRSCDANGIQDIYIIERQNTFTTKEGVSMGTGKWIHLYKFNYHNYDDPTIACLKELKEKNYVIYGMSSYTIPNKRNIQLSELDLSQPTAFVFGSEKDGLSFVAREQIDQFIQIPIYGFVESYNISVACGITLYYTIQRVKTENINWQLKDEEKAQILFDWLKQEFPNYQYIISKHLKI